MNSSSERIDSLNDDAWSMTLSSPERALGLAERALAEAEAAEYPEGAAAAMLNVGWCEYYLARHGPAVESFQRALEAFGSLDDELGVMKALNALGVAYMDMGRYERAMDFYTRSLEEARKQGNRLREAATLNNIGEVCLAFGEIKEALDYLLRAYETIPDDEDGEIIGSILLDIGKAYHRMGNWSLAREFAEKAMGVAQKCGNKQSEGQCWHLLGLVSLATDRLELAASHYLKALGLAEELKNVRERASIQLDLGSIHALTGDIGLALERYGLALASAEEIGAKRLINTAYERLSEAHETIGEYDRALDYYKRFSRFEHEALSEDASRKIKNITVQYEVEKSRQEAEIYRLKNIELKEKTEELESANRQILAISETGRLITASLDLDTIISTLYKTLSRYIPFDLFGLALYEEEDGSLDYRTYIIHGKRIQRPSLLPDPKRSFAAACLRDKATIFVPDTDHIPEGIFAGEQVPLAPRSGSLVFLPLVIDDRAIGVLTIQSEIRGALTPRHQALMEALTPYVAIAIENSIIHDRLEAYNRAIRGEKEELEKAALTITHLANHDPLTGLPNRRLLFELLQNTFAVAARNGSKVAVIYLDLDNFKPINDSLGHSAGDKVLVAVASRLSSLLRASDTVARVGGDEFVAVLTSVKDRADIVLAARKILEECERPLTVDSTECRVGFSMGIAVFPDDGDSKEVILGAADEAMYRVKHAYKRGFAFAGADPLQPAPNR